jgi:hypothetical protein
MDFKKSAAPLEQFQDSAITKGLNHISGGGASTTHQGSKTLPDGEVVTWNWDVRKDNGSLHTGNSGTADDWLATEEGKRWLAA